MEIKPIGRILRFILGLFFLIIAFPYYLFHLSPLTFLIFKYYSDLNSVIQAIGITVGLFVLFVLVHFIINKYFKNINRWIGALLALSPAVILFYLGEAKAIAALTYLGISLIFASLFKQPRCEVMVLLNLLLKSKHI